MTPVHSVTIFQVVLFNKASILLSWIMWLYPGSSHKLGEHKVIFTVILISSCLEAALFEVHHLLQALHDYIRGLINASLLLLLPVIQFYFTFVIYSNSYTTSKKNDFHCLVIKHNLYICIVWFLMFLQGHSEIVQN